MNERDQVCQLAKSNPKKALEKAREVGDPWLRAQALAWVARFTKEDPVPIASEAAKAADACDDDFKRSSVRAWEIAALAERNCARHAQAGLKQALAQATLVQPASSRSEALLLLLQAACAIGTKQASQVNETLLRSCASQEHWRCKRAVHDGGKMISGELKPRKFFW